MSGVIVRTVAVGDGGKLSLGMCEEGQRADGERVVNINKGVAVAKPSPISPMKDFPLLTTSESILVGFVICI
jgi:hypothetical protein